jgi:deoxycytidylate deaminase
MGYKSGEGLVEGPAAHAETNCIANAARIGASTINSTLYMDTQIPCKDCMILLVNAGICEVVVTDLTPYHEMSIDIARFGNIKLRRFEL